MGRTLEVEFVWLLLYLIMEFVFRFLIEDLDFIALWSATLLCLDCGWWAFWEARTQRLECPFESSTSCL